MDTNVALITGILVQQFKSMEVDDQGVLVDDGNFRFEWGVRDIVRQELEVCSAEDDNCPADVDDLAPSGRWHRAANILNAKCRKLAEKIDAPLATADWSWKAMMEVKGVSV